MRISFLVILWSIGIQLMAQPYKNNVELKIHNADELILIAKTKGLPELEKIVNPVDLIYVDSSYASTIIDLEFKSDFWGKQHDNKNITIYELPKHTLKLAEDFNNGKAGKILFDYYSNLPKFSKSDTIYSIYNDLDDFLKVLVKFNSPRLIERLKKDYYDWCKIVQNSPRKNYPTIEEMRRTTFEESMKFRTNDLYVDCNLVTLQIAGALNYLKVKGFDETLIEKLKAKQTYPFAKRYSFPQPELIDSKAGNSSSKTIQNSLGIKDFGRDYQKIEKLIIDNFKNCCDSEVYEIIEKGSKAYVSMLRNNGYDFFTIKLNSDNKIVINLVSSIIE